MSANPDWAAGTMTTWRRQDSEPIIEYDFVLHEEWFECDDEPTELVKETWVRQTQENVTLGPVYDDEDEGTV